MIIDADTHILEGQTTWDYLQPHEERFRPAEVPNWWIVDGGLRHRHFDDLSIPEGVRRMTDVKGRVDKMDEFGVDIQVVYPSMMLAPTTEREEGLYALCRSYNRFMAEACAQSKGRLRWILIPPVETMQEALAELDFGAQHGACGVLLRSIEGRRMMSSPYFDPLYEKAQALNLPICVHVGLGNRLVWDVLAQDGFAGGATPVLSAFHNVLIASRSGPTREDNTPRAGNSASRTQSVMDRYPNLRFGFIEAGAQWVPYVVGEVMRNGAHRGMEGLPVDEKQLVPSKRVFVTCRIQDDLNYVLQWTGKKNLMTGTDFGHNDASTELFAFRDLPRIGNVDEEAIQGIVGNNARSFYALE
jgi:predicted TIM-barrel fold metal-dependent hydrolase